MTHLNHFKSVDTGDGYVALTFETPERYLMVVSDADGTEIPLVTDPMTLNVYRNEAALYNGEGEVYREEFIFLSNWADAYQRAEKAIKDDLTIVTSTSLDDVDLIIVKYIEGGIKLQYEVMDVTFTTWSVDSVTETIHRMLGHNNFIIKRIYK